MKPKLIFCSLLLTFSSSIINAQTLQAWQMDQYKMKFKAPDNMSVIENDGDGFKASNSSMTLSIFPRKGEGLTYDGMKNAIIKWAGEVSLMYNEYNSKGNKQPIYLSDINGYWGCAIDGTRNGLSSTMLLLIDPDYPDISFYISINYSSEYYHDAVKMIESFQPY
jgi:hypothetical protein